MIHRRKSKEVEEVFHKLKIDDLADLGKYGELRSNVERALADMQAHYRELAFSKIYMNRESIKKIDKAIVEISAHLKQTHTVFDSQCQQLVKISRDDSVIHNVIAQFADTNIKTLGQFALPQKAVDEEIAQLCDGVRFDMNVIDAVNRNKLYMT